MVYCLLIRQGQKVKIKAKGCLLFVYPTGPWKFKRKAKGCLLFVYPAGPGSLKEVKSC